MSGEPGYTYPMHLGREDMALLLPHRGDIFVCQQLCIEGPHHFTGMARWALGNHIIKGHFPGMPIVPGVMLIEAMAQLTGAGLLAGDPYVKTFPEASVGVLAGVRNCWFKSPVLPDTDVQFSIQCRQMATQLVQASGLVSVVGVEAAKLDISIAYVPREQLFGAMALQP